MPGFLQMVSRKKDVTRTLRTSIVIKELAMPYLECQELEECKLDNRQDINKADKDLKNLHRK